MQTKHADVHLNLTTSAHSQIEIAKWHAKKLIELAKRQIEHANGQIECNDEHTPTYAKWQVEWQIEQAKNQIEQANG